MVSAVRPTLGPIAGGVAIDHINKTKDLPEFLDNGGLIARRIIQLADRNEDMAAMLVRSMLVRQYEMVGDGTATAAVLLEAIFNEGVRYIAAGGNAMSLRHHLEEAVPLLLSLIDAQRSELNGRQAIADMAHTLCQDREMADLLGEAFDLVGGHGRIEIRESYGRHLHLEDVEGRYYETGLIARSILPDENSARIELLNPAFFICDLTINDHRALYPVLQTAFQAGIKELVLVVRNLSEQGVALLATNNKLDKLKTIAIKVPGLNEADRMAALDDLAVLTGAIPIIEVTGETLEQVTPGHFGSARRVWADMDNIGIIGSGGDPRKLRQHIARLKQAYQQADDPSRRQAALKRIGLLLGGTVTLWIGGFSENEINARKKRSEQTVLTLRKALEEGVVPGAGVAYMTARRALQNRSAHTQGADERAAWRILSDALAAPARTIYTNAGYDPGEVLAQLSAEDAGMGFDVLSGTVVNTGEAGIWDSAATIKASLTNAIHTAALALTIDSFVHMRHVPMVKNPDGTTD